MPSSIPASAIVNVLPSVISAGGTGLDLVGLILTDSAQLPFGSVFSFSNAADVSSFFGPLATETTLANTYFAGYTGSPIKPALLRFSRYATAAASAWLRSGAVSGLSLAELQALSGSLTISVNGVNKTAAAINLSSATSFSNAATLIQSGFSAPGFTVTYDSISGSFVFATTATGASATLGFATGTLADPLKLTSALRASLSQGSDIMVPGPAMAAVIAVTQDFVTFTTAWKPSDADMLLFAAWANSAADRYAYVGWDSNIAATASNDTTSFGAQVKANDWSGTVAVYDPSNGANVAAFLMGAVASLNFDARNGRATMAFRTGSVLPGVTNQTIGDHLIVNGYNFIGSYATANDEFTFFYPGQISGKFDWVDSWIGQVWLGNALQLALMTLLTEVGQVPYNADGYALIEAAMDDPVQRALNFGAIRAGVSLSTLQQAEIDNAAGGKVSDVVEQRGWFIKIQDPGASVRASRGSPVIHLWYTDGQSVQKVSLASVMVQ